MEVLAGLPWVAAEVPKGYFSSQDVPLRSVGSKPQAELPSLKHHRVRQSSSCGQGYCFFSG